MPASPLDGVQLKLVDSLDEALALKRWLGERRETPLGIDTETGGLSPYHDQLRMVQVGDLHTGWAIPWPDWAGFTKEILSQYDGDFVAHNLSFDYRFLSIRGGIKLPWHRLHDTMTLATLDDPVRPRGLKELAARLVDRSATAGERALHEGMSQQKWTWATVPYDFAPYWCVPLSTQILTKRGWLKHDELKPSDQTLGYEDGVLRWTSVSTVSRFTDAPVVRFGNRYWSTVATEDHRWLARPRNKTRLPIVCPECGHTPGKDRRRILGDIAYARKSIGVHRSRAHGYRPDPGFHDRFGEPEFMTTKQAWLTEDVQLQLTGYAEGGLSPCTPDEAAVIAWVLSDGYLWRGRGTYNAQIIQSSKKFHEEIRSLLKRTGAYVSERVVGGGATGCYSFQLKAQYVRRLWEDNRIDDGLDLFVLSLSQDARRAWADAWYMAEGTHGERGKKSKSIAQNEGPKLDALALTFFLEGKLPLIGAHTGKSGRGICRSLTIAKTPIGNSRNTLKVYESAGRCDVWCPTTGLGSWVARDADGHIFLTGNCYSALDPVLTVHLWQHLYPRVMADSPGVYDLERGVTRITTNMMMHGMKIDRPYVTEAIERLRQFTVRAREWLKEAHGITSPLAPRQLDKAFSALGYHVQAFTPTGQPKFDKETLTAIKDAGDIGPAQLASYILAVRHTEKVIGSYLENFLQLADENDLIHCQIHPLMARTGRMCIPDSHRILTQRGVLHVDDIRVGDLTLDAGSCWTPIQAVHRYKDAETVIYAHNHARLEATKEHRWVLSMEGRPSEKKIEPISDLRRNVHLTPDTSRQFDFSTREVMLDGTDATQFAALVGWLVSDGRCHDDGPGAGLRSMIYQTERKFYKECLRSIPADAIMYDRLTANGESHHEIGIKARWLRPRLAAAGLRADPLLRTSSTLLPWVLSLTIPELEAFFSAVWLADGSVAHPENKTISSDSEPLRCALQYTGYRLGLRSHVFHTAPSPWGTKERAALKFVSSPVTTRFLTRTPSRSDVWCVTTESGTFTAWSEGPYLTGNSITDPALQTLHRDDKVVRGSFVPHKGSVFISCDADQIEARMAAHFSADAGLIGAFHDADRPGGLDFFSGVASQLFGETIRKGDHRRQLTKNMTYCVPLDTLVLTKRGWLSHDEIRIGDETIGYDMEDDVARWTRIEAIHHPGKADLISIGNSFRNFVATPDHRWVVRRRRPDRVLFKHTSDISTEDSIIMTAPVSDDGDTVFLTETEAAVMGWLFSDGDLRIEYSVTGPSQSAGKKRAVYGQIRQSESKHSAHIREILSDVPHKEYHPDSHDSEYNVWVIQPAWLRALAQRLGLYDEPLDPVSLASRIDARSRDIILREMRLADGSPFAKSNKKKLEFYVAVLFMSGRCPGVHWREPDGAGWQQKPIAMVREGLPTMTEQRLVKERRPREEVFCVTTGLGSWAMRQGDQITITGNCYVYGGGLEKMAKTAGVPIDQMRPIRDAYLNRFPGLRSLARSTEAEAQMAAATTGVAAIRTPYGRRLPAADDRIYTALNYKIQGHAAEILKKGMLDLDAAGLGDYLRLPVHDEILLEVPEEQAEDIMRLVVDTLTDRETYHVPITWGAVIMKDRWVKGD